MSTNGHIAPPTEQEREEHEDAMRLAAKHILSNKQLREFIAKVEPTMRQAVYNCLKPHLKFKPLSYMLVKP